MTILCNFWELFHEYLKLGFFCSLQNSCFMGLYLSIKSAFCDRDKHTRLGEGRNVKSCIMH